MLSRRGSQRGRGEESVTCTTFDKTKRRFEQIGFSLSLSAKKAKSSQLRRVSSSLWGINAINAPKQLSRSLSTFKYNKIARQHKIITCTAQLERVSNWTMRFNMKISGFCKRKLLLCWLTDHANHFKPLYHEHVCCEPFRRRPLCANELIAIGNFSKSISRKTLRSLISRCFCQIQLGPGERRRSHGE
jgi:site-specific DNA-cytosine methylase